MSNYYEDYYFGPEDDSSSSKNGPLEANEGNLGPSDPYGFDEEEEQEEEGVEEETAEEETGNKL